MEKKFHDLFKEKIDSFVHLIYRLTKNFPREELYGAGSQLRRAALSVMLNYVEGYARKRRLVKINFFEMSYGSIKECSYLLDFAFAEGWLRKEEYQQTSILAEEISAMFWKTIESLRNENS